MSDNLRSDGTIQPTSLEGILHQMNQAGEFQVSMLTSTAGLPIATVPATYDSDFTAAMVALIQRASIDAKSQLGMADVDEVTIQDRDRIRLVCRYIALGRERLILVVVVPPGQAYRSVTNRAVSQLRQLLS